MRYHLECLRMEWMRAMRGTMVLDTLTNCLHYHGMLSGRLGIALDFLSASDLAALDLGRHAIDGDRVFAMVHEYDTKPRGPWEAHQQYADVHVMVDGEEEVGYAPIDRLRVRDPYLPADDCERMDGDGAFFLLTCSMFAVFFPQDAHQPGVLVDHVRRVKKVVVKVRVGA